MANYNLDTNIETASLQWTRAIPPPDPRRFEPPFIPIPDIQNFRGLSPFSASGGKTLRTNLLYRCAEPSKINSEGHAAIAALPITTVFDLRSVDELERNAHKAPVVAIPGTTRVHVPVFPEAGTPEQQKEHMKRYLEKGVEGFANAYEDIVRDGKGACRTIFEFVRDRGGVEGEGCLVHCTAGKDRTGVFFAIALLLVGVSEEDIKEEYQLTQIGLTAWAPVVMTILLQDPLFEGDEEKVLKLASARKENLAAFLERFRELFVDAEGYLKNHLEFSQEDVEKIRANLVQ